MTSLQIHFKKLPSEQQHVITSFAPRAFSLIGSEVVVVYYQEDFSVFF